MLYFISQIEVGLAPRGSFNLLYISSGESGSYVTICLTNVVPLKIFCHMNVASASPSSACRTLARACQNILSSNNICGSQNTPPTHKDTYIYILIPLVKDLKKVSDEGRLLLVKDRYGLALWPNLLRQQPARQYLKTKNLGTLWAPTSNWKPFGPLDFVLCGLWELMLCDPRKVNSLSSSSSLIHVMQISMIADERTNQRTSRV